VRGERGFALVAVLLVLTILTILGAEFALSMRLEASAVRAYKDGVTGMHLAEAAVEQAIREIAGEYTTVGTCRDDDPVRFYKADRTLVPTLPRKEVPLGTGQFEYDISDEEARLNVNVSQPERLERLLTTLGIQRNERDAIMDSILDWRDANDIHRLNGAESDDYYLKLPAPYRARNANFDSVQELLQVKGVTETIFRGTDDRPGLIDAVTVKTPGPVNINTARTPVLHSLGLSDAEVSQIVQTRCSDGPYLGVPGQFGGRGFVVTSRTFRIQARGVVGGRTAAEIRAVVQKRQGQTGPVIAVLEWTVDR
jgi:general secretion pathway protein K